MHKYILNLSHFFIALLLVGYIPNKDVVEDISYLQESIEAKEKKAFLKKEVQCLAENIYFEASGESKEGKHAVAQVTINRVMNKNYPKTVCGVVTQKYKNICQFSWNCNNVIRKFNKKAWEESMKIAEFRYFQNKKVTLQNALYFHNTTIEPPYWAEQKRVVNKIGNHIFYADI
jgi:spore germination cell wall hydrolase CwlJ-like protein